MNGHSESTGEKSVLSSDSVRRVTQYQAAGTNARLKLFALLKAQGVSVAEADDLVGIADRNWSRRGGRSAGAAELAVHIADVRQCERAGLVRFEAFVRGTGLLRAHPNTTKRRRVLEALGEAGGLCTVRTVEMSSGDVILCTREAGHYDPDDLPGFKRGKSDGTPGGWHLASGSIWSDAGAACYPHAAVWKTTGF
ncbi:hypothetical protein M8I34_25960 [Streptomyces sp. MCA2]|uniref:hypothetical protein n=1 Tax=Streptomyces sp. MCA2 TaxID=2944805 RepID=UPI0020214D0C|nr:hypothetical protein [Streptomyces sp. MCA2]MCL7494819.1 hypothetical protein [Streptomyces sp. MCA2]